MLSSSNINYNSKINAISMQLTEDTIGISSDILKGKISDKDIIKQSRIIYDEFINDKEVSKIENLINDNRQQNKKIIVETEAEEHSEDENEFMDEIKNIW